MKWEKRKTNYRDIVGTTFVSVPCDGLHPDCCDDPSEASELLHQDDVTARSTSTESGRDPARAAADDEDFTFCQNWNCSRTFYKLHSKKFF